MLDLLVTHGDMEKVEKIFTTILNQELVKPDEITFNTIIKGCCKNKDLPNAVKYFKKMREHDL